MRKFKEISFAVLPVGVFMYPFGSSCSLLLAVPMLLPPPPAAVAAATAATFSYC